MTTAHTTRTAALTLTNVTASYGRGTAARPVLTPTSLTVHPGESVAVIGRSGAGKSTLADIVLGLRTPATGEVRVAGGPWCGPSQRPHRSVRHLVQGVPQDPAAALVPRWTLRQSIALAVRKLTAHGDTDAIIREAAERAQLPHNLLDRRPSEVSGGQAQRAAIARALAVHPRVLVADEPTSALDEDTAHEVASALLDIARESDLALLLVTHDPAFAARCTRTVTLTAPTQ